MINGMTIRREKNMRDNIYGPVTEHPEKELTDADRFTVTIRRHPFTTDDPRGVPPLGYRSNREMSPVRCSICPFPFEHEVHQAAPRGGRRWRDAEGGARETP
jgi:hypothetical protein